MNQQIIVLSTENALESAPSESRGSLIAERCRPVVCAQGIFLSRRAGDNKSHQASPPFFSPF